MTQKFISILFVLISIQLFGQKEIGTISEGNKLFKSEKFADASIKYKEALEKEKHPITQYNLGTSQYKEGKFDESILSLESSINSQNSANQKSRAHYNLGNAYFKSDKLCESIRHYKEALKYNALDKDTQRNLLKAKLKLKQMQQQQQQNQDKSKNDKDQKQDKKQEQEEQKNSDNNNDKKSNDKDESQNQNSNNGKQDNTSQNKQQMSQEEKQRLADFVKSEDQKVQQKLQRSAGKRSKNTKDW